MAVSSYGGMIPTSQSSSSQQSSGTSFIPSYSETPILESIAQYAQSMAPQVYQWGMDQYARNQGNIDTLMKNAMTYASPQHIASDMGMAEAGVQQGNEAGRQSAIRDLQSYGIDPSSGRYAELDQANRVQGAAAAAGAGNQQRMADIAQGTGMQEQAISAGLQNTQIGYGASDAMNKLLATGMSLKYPPLGQTQEGSGSSESVSYPSTGGGGGGGGGGGKSTGTAFFGGGGGGYGFNAAGIAKGGYISPDESPTDGAAIDDVPANLTAGEFVVPKDVVNWKGKEFFYKLMAQARKTRATSGGDDKPKTGYNCGGAI